MTAKVQAIPSNSRGVIPSLCVRGADKAIAFYVKAFGAKELYRLVEPSGKVGHAEIEIAGGMIMLSDEYPDHGALSPATVGGTPVRLHIYVEDVDAVVSRAVEAGAKLTGPVEDQFYGDRLGMVEDPFGHKWYVATHKVDVSPEEMQKHWDESLKAGKA